MNTHVKPVLLWCGFCAALIGASLFLKSIPEDAKAMLFPACLIVAGFTLIWRIWK